MKILNYKIYLFLLSTLFVGCMPDSLTKFKKEADTKPLAKPPETVITIEDGETYDLANVQNISRFHYVDSNMEAENLFHTKTNQSLTLSPVMNGTFGIAPGNLKDRLFISCTITPSLPYGLRLLSNSNEPCKIEGTPTEKSFSNIGGSLNSPIDYTVTLKTRGKNGITTTNTSSISIGVYEEIGDFQYDQSDIIMLKLDIEVDDALDDVVVNNNPSLVYPPNGFISSATGVAGVIKSIDKEQAVIGIKKLTPLKIQNLSAMFTNELINSENLGLGTPIFVCQNNIGAMAKVIRIPRGINPDTIYVEMLGSKSFQSGPGSYIKAFYPSLSELNSTPVMGLCDLAPNNLDSTSTILTNNFDYNFDIVTDPALDFNLQFYQKKANLTSVEMAFEMNQNIGTGVPTVYPAIKIKNHLFSKLSNSENGVIFSVSPPLPAGLSIKPITGELTGKFTTTFSHSVHTITARNPISVSTTTLTLNSLNAPKDLSYTTNQFFSINTLMDIFEGIKLKESISPPMALETAKLTKVINKYSNGNSYHLSANTLNGKVSYLNRIKVPNSLGENPIINTNNVISYNLAFAITPTAVPANDLVNYSVGGYIKSSTLDDTLKVALARITHIYKSPTRHVIFAQQIKLDTDLVMPRFASGVQICRTTNNRVGCHDPVALHSVESNNLALHITDTPAIASQFRFISVANNSSGHLESYSPTDHLYLLSDISVSPKPSSGPFPLAPSRHLKQGDFIAYLNSSDVVTGAKEINEVYAAANVFIVERGEYVEIQPNVLNPTYSNFTITPKLPPGLTLNSRTGQILGIPTKRTQRLNYTVLAINLVGQSSYDIELEVKDYFRVKNAIDPEVEVSSEHLHLAGLNRSTHDCKIDASEMTKRGHIGTADIFDTTCILDIEESDLFERGINLQVSVGDSVCTDVEFEPYSFQQYPPIKTNPLEKRYYNIKGCKALNGPGLDPPPYNNPALWIPTVTPPDITSSDVCKGNFTETGGPNCDEGKVTYLEEIWTPSELGACDVLSEVVTTVIDCGGEANNCRQGAVRDVITGDSFNSGGKSVTEGSWSKGLTKDYPITAPREKGLMSNLHIANSITNACLKTSRTETEALLTYSANTDATASPFGKANPFYSFYCRNASRTVLSRIKVVVREWDLEYKLTSFIDQFNPDSSLGLNNALNNSSDSGYYGHTYNDFKSWDNLSSSAIPGNPTACDVDSPTTAGRYDFPGEDY